MSDVPSTELTFAGLGSPDKAIMRFGKSNGHVDDYGHCDLVWSRHASREIFPPIIDWLDQRQPGTGPSPQAVSPLLSTARSQPVLRTESMQICDQVSNSCRIKKTFESGRNPASASPLRAPSREAARARRDGPRPGAPVRPGSNHR